MLETLLERIRSNDPSLTSINLADQLIGDEEVRQLVDALKVNHIINTLNLNTNKIGDEGARHLAAALKTNTSLNFIFLGFNKIQYKGAGYLADALKENPHLLSFNLSCNLIGVEGMKFLAQALKFNHTLICFSAGFSLGPMETRFLTETLEQNKSILWIQGIENQELRNLIQNNHDLFKERCGKISSDHFAELSSEELDVVRCQLNYVKSNEFFADNFQMNIESISAKLDEYLNRLIKKELDIHIIPELSKTILKQLGSDVTFSDVKLLQKQRVEKAEMNAANHNYVANEESRRKNSDTKCLLM